MKNNYSLYEIIKDTDRAKKIFLEYTIKTVRSDIHAAAYDFRFYLKYLYDFFDTQEIICIIKTDTNLKYVPVIEDKSLHPNKTHIWSKHGLDTREQAEYELFKRAFQYLETKLDERDK